MTSKGRLIRNILLAVLILALLGGGYYFAVRWEPKEDIKNTDKSNSSVYIVSENIAEIASIHIKNEKAEYDIIRENINAGISYRIPQIYGLEADTYEMASAFGVLANLSATREVIADNVSEFGIDAMVSYTIKKTDGTEITVIVGDEVPTGGEFYCVKNGDDKLYTVSANKVAYTKKTPEDYRIAEITNIPDVREIKNFVVYKNEIPIMKIRATTDAEKMESIQAGVWMCEYPWKEFAADAKLAEFLELFIDMRAIGFADTMNKAIYRVEFSTESVSYNISIGDLTDNGVYVRDENSGMCYIVGRELKTAIDNINPNDYITKLVWLADISDIKSVSIVSEDRSCIMEPESKTKPYTINGFEVSENTFKEKYQAVIGTMFNERAEVPVKGDAYVTIAYEFLDGHNEVVNFYEYNERDIIAVRPDGTTVVLIRSEVDKILKILQ